MKRERILKAGIALVAVMLVAMFMGCESPTDPKPEPPPPPATATGADLLRLTVAGIQVQGTDLPNLITKTEWEGSDFLSALDGVTKQVFLSSQAALANVAFSAIVSSKATVAFGAGYDSDRTLIDFTKTSPLSFSPGESLFIKVTSEDGATVNYYQFQLLTVSGNASLSALTVAGESAGMGTPAAAWDGARASLGNVSLSDTQKTDAKIVATPAATGGVSKYAKVTGGDAPAFGDGDTFTFADGDFLYIEVTAADGTTKLYYKVEIWIGRNANLSDIVFGTLPVTSMGTPAASLAEVTQAGYIVFLQTQPVAGFSVTITPEDDEATINYIAGDGTVTESAITTAYTAPVAIPVADQAFLYVKVTSASGNVVQYYKIEVGHQQAATITAGSPEIKASSEKYIDPIWDTAGIEIYNISKIAPFGDTTSAYREEGVNHPRYTYGTARALWDYDGLYIYVDVIDSEVNGDDSGWTTSNAHQYDSFELFINEDLVNGFTATPGTSTEFEKASGQYRVGADGKLSGHTPAALAVFTALNKASAWKKDDGSGYIIIMQAPWLHASETGLAPVDGKEIGFELQINACTGTNDRDGVMVWNNIAHSNYQTNTAYGKATLTGTPPTNAQRPTITANPQAVQVASVGEAATLSVTASVSDSGTLSYQWYEAASASGTGTEISGATSATYSVTNNTAGSYFYYVVVTNTNNTVDGNKTANVTSNRARITVTAAVALPDNWEEKITAANNSVPVYGFNLPAGKTFGDYALIKYKVKMDPDSEKKNARARAWGNFDLATWTSTASPVNMQNATPNGLLLNTNGNVDYSSDDWTEVTVAFGNRDTLNTAADIKAASGVVVVGFGMFPNSDGGTRTYYLKDIELWSDTDGTEKIPALHPEDPLLWGGDGANAFAYDGNANALGLTRELQ